MSTTATAAAPAANEVIHQSNESVNRILKALLEGAIPAAEERTRLEVTRTLKNRFDMEMLRLQAAFDRRLTQVAMESEALAQLKLESTLASTRDILQVQIGEEIKSAYQSKLDDADAQIAELQRQITESIQSNEIAMVVRSEVMRVQSLLDQIDKALSDPETDIGTQIRLKREQAEIQAYLKGLQYSLGRAPDISICRAV